MCPMCISTMVVVAASALPTGGLAALIARKVDPPPPSKDAQVDHFKQDIQKEK
jgi:hypothetical protein